ncbi:putative nucleic acid-binding protein [Rosa chinensis]|uniref:Putative nucleic acid-binding protein n=1 Tax=Rosa chinensis TaxID=74649 RepID=A0A2P6RNW5_ROSCH|nr:putative nucleic acid-binding protein [Rosa chinensis]
MCTYTNARGQGRVFNVEFTNEDGTKIQATMFNEAARKFCEKFQLRPCLQCGVNRRRWN